MCVSTASVYEQHSCKLFRLTYGKMFNSFNPEYFDQTFQVGPDFQMIYLHAEKDYNICENEAGKFLSVLEICAACKQLGIVILDALKYAHKNYVSNFQSDKIKLKVYSDTPQHLIHFMSKELHKVMSLHL